MIVAALGALAIISALHLLLTFALIRRVRAMEAPSALEPLPAPGTPIAAFEATTSNGEPLTDALFGAPTIVGFFRPGCGPCETTRGALVAAPPELPVVAFIDGTADDPDARTLLASLGQVARVAYTGVGDAAQRAFRPAGFPSLYRIEGGQIAAAGHRLADVLP